MRFLASMSSTSGFKGRGRGGRWHRSYSERATAPPQQPSPPNDGAPNASSGPIKPHSRPHGPRGPRPYTGHYTPPPPRGPRPYTGHYTPPPPRGRGPEYSYGPSPDYFQSPPSHHFRPGLGQNQQRPPQFHGQGPPYTGPEHQAYMQQYYNQQPPPYWYSIGAPNGMYGQMSIPKHNMPQQSVRANKLPMYRRKWRFPSVRVPRQSERFRLLSYNILADYLAVQHTNLYSHVPSHVLSWPWRMRNLLFEFQLWSPDVLCLQEVDRFPELQTEMESRGYSGIWKIRTGKAIDGCAIFWRTDRFKSLHHEYIEFSSIGLKDNVAQICVLESIVQRTPENDSSSKKISCNRVVVCNIHVLFNPKRGDIKLGQVRTLIDQACVVSKNWGDPPVVICGDFNSTPNLDLSGLARSQISGQETGNALASVPRSYKFPRSISVGTINSNRPSTVQSGSTGVCTTSSSLVHMKESDITKEAQSSEDKGLALSTESHVTEVSDPVGNDCIAEAIQEANVTRSMDHAAAQGLQELINGSSDVISSNNNDPHIEKLHLGESQSESLVEDDNDVKSDFINTAHSTTIIVEKPEKAYIQKKNETIGTDFDASQESQESNYAAASTNFTDKHSDSGETSQAENLGDDSKILKGNCAIGSSDEENPDPNFLSELQGAQDEFGFKWSQDESSFEEKNSPEIIEGPSSYCAAPYSNDPYRWTPEELKAATGSEDCTFVQHGLKLRSVYTDVEDNDGTKGPHGEPEATSYSQTFLGTVDYIWSSEDLRTVGVLDTIPKCILLETKGFPTKKWGSDHLALVCELAFTNE